MASSPITPIGLGLTSRGQRQAVRLPYYDFDAIGSTVGMSGPVGTYQNLYRYLPFGELPLPSLATELVPNPFQFVGQFGVMTQGEAGWTS